MWVRVVSTGKTIKIPRGTAPKITPGGRFVLATIVAPFSETGKNKPKNALAIAEVKTGAVTTIANVERAAASEDGRFVAWVALREEGGLEEEEETEDQAHGRARDGSARARYDERCPRGVRHRVRVRIELGQVDLLRRHARRQGQRVVPPRTPIRRCAAHAETRGRHREVRVERIELSLRLHDRQTVGRRRTRRGHPPDRRHAATRPSRQNPRL